MRRSQALLLADAFFVVCTALASAGIGMLVAGEVVTTEGCSATTANAVIQDITPAGACIADALLAGGATDPLQVIAQCAGTTISDVIQVVEMLLAAQPDAGPDAGMSAVTTRLASVHALALGIKASK